MKKLLSTALLTLFFSSSIGFSSDNAGPDFSIRKNQEEVLTAIENDNVATVEKFLDQGMKVDLTLTSKEDTLTALGFAARHNAKKVAEFLLKKGAKVYPDDLTSPFEITLSALKTHKDLHILRILLDNARHKKINLDQFASQETTILAQAIDADNAQAVNMILEAGANPNAESGSFLLHMMFGFPLNIAAKNGNFQIVERLVNKGATVTQRDAGGDLPLHSAIKGLDAYSKKVEKQGISHESQDKISEFTAIIKLLLSKGSSLNDKSEKGESAKNLLKDMIDYDFIPNDLLEDLENPDAAFVKG